MTTPDILSPMVLGTMTFGDKVDTDGAGALLDVALEAGITHIDTANGYAAGAAERILSTLLAGKRDSVTIATKAGMYTGDTDGNSPLSPKGLRLSVEASLSRLGTDYVDLFYLHQPDRAASLDDTLTTVAELLPKARSGSSVSRTSRRGRSVKSSVSPIASALLGPSSLSSSTTCSHGASKTSTRSTRRSPD